jgi:hypothetical protein
MKLTSLDWRIGLAAAAGVAVAGGVLAYRWFSRPPDPDQIERQRRSHLNRIGRIAEGRVVELREVTGPLDIEAAAATNARRRVADAEGGSPPDGKRQLVCYTYSISGVSYETAQDVTGLSAGDGLGQFTAGQSASVKYDPANPSNSILVADNWSGLT